MEFDFLTEFKNNVKLYTNKIALVFEKKSYSYKQLDEYSDAVAKYLYDNEINNNHIIGILMNRNEDILISILGILKAGCTFLPIDIDFPKERIEYIIKDSKVNVLMTNIKENNYKNIKIINFYNIEKKYLNIKYMKPYLAYIIYTSGSTGNPKGVCIKYDSLNNLLSSMIYKPGIKDTDALLSLTTFCFDISILELLLPLSIGATVVIANRRCQIDVESLENAIYSYNITIMQATPVTWNMLINYGWKNNTKIKILCGGEALTLKLFNEINQISDDAWNMYGPTETTIWSSIDKLQEMKGISIGMPIDNTLFLILDENLNETNKGELYIGGLGLAEGYLYNDSLTKQKFIEVDNVLYYKTGDIVHKKNDGRYEYICRNDFQVKVNGYRIELGEIENTFYEVKEIEQAVVIYNKEINSIIGFIKCSDIVSDEKLYKHLSKRLPTYMIPNLFKRVEKFPLTDNNKIDRKSLLNQYFFEKKIDYNENIYAQNLSSIEVVNLISKLESEGLYLSYDKLISGLSINESIDTKLKEIFESNKHRFKMYNLQNLMYYHMLLYPNSPCFYEYKLIKIYDHSINEINTVLGKLIENLHVFKYEFEFLKEGNYIKTNSNKRTQIKRFQTFDYPKLEKGNLIQLSIISNSYNYILIQYHHMILDGESINILIGIIARLLLKKEVNYYEHNTFSDGIKLLEEKIPNNIKSEEYNFKKYFSANSNITNEIKGLKFKLEIKPIILFCNKYSISISIFIQYCLSKALLFVTNNDITYGLVNSNRAMLDNNTRLLLGNIINVLNHFYRKDDIKDISNFMKEYLENTRNHNIEFYNNKINNCELILIINNFDYKLYGLLNKAKLEIANENYYENNNYNINIRCDINDYLDIYISYKNIEKIELFNSFVGKFIKYLNAEET